MASAKLFPFTLILRDPLANSFISAPLGRLNKNIYCVFLTIGCVFVGSFLPPELDVALKIQEYTRSYEEDEDLGLNDINTRDFESGVNIHEYYETEILPDLITHVVPKGPDHPTLFAKGVEDSCPCGKVYSHLTAPEEHHEATATSTSTDNYQPTADDYYSPPAGWSFQHTNDTSQVLVDKLEKVAHANEPLSSGQDDSENAPVGVDETYGQRKFDPERDGKLKFLPYENFSGRKAGYVFRLGSNGLGYYEDDYVPPSVSATVESTTTMSTEA